MLSAPFDAPHPRSAWQGRERPIRPPREKHRRAREGGQGQRGPEQSGDRHHSQSWLSLRERVPLRQLSVIGASAMAASAMPVHARAPAVPSVFTRRSGPQAWA
jgi:hypothetical protein